MHFASDMHGGSTNPGRSRMRVFVEQRPRRTQQAAAAARAGARATRLQALKAHVALAVAERGGRARGRQRHRDHVHAPERAHKRVELPLGRAVQEGNAAGGVMLHHTHVQVAHGLVLRRARGGGGASGGEREVFHGPLRPPGSCGAAPMYRLLAGCPARVEGPRALLYAGAQIQLTSICKMAPAGAGRICSLALTGVGDTAVT